MKPFTTAAKIIFTAGLLASMLVACKRNDTPATGTGDTTTTPGTTGTTSGTSGTSGTGGTSGTSGTGTTDTTPPADKDKR